MVWQIILIALAGVFLAVFIKTSKPEYAMVVGMATALIIFYFVMELFLSLKERLSGLTGVFAENTMYFKVLFKMMGVAYLCEFCCGMCKDAGFQTVGSQVEIFGKIAILLSGVPIIIALVETIQNFSM